MNDNPITSGMSVNEAIRQRPDAVRVFQEFGIDACCGGALTIDEACALHRLDPNALLSQLNNDYSGEDACTIQR